MIVGGYTLDLYCDHKDHKPGTISSSGEQFFGETFSQCKRLASRAGWKFSRNKSPAEAYCPACVKKKPRAKE